MNRPCPTASCIVLLTALACTTQAAADERIRQIDYDPQAVVRLDGCMGFQTMVQFAPGERIENIGIGDASRWLIAPNKRADILFVKPAFASSHSNMTVSTSLRRYNFELRATPGDACRRGRVLYTLQFRYPADTVTDAAVVAAAAEPTPAADATPAPAPRNSAYSFSGATGNVPQRVFDDGRSTWFHWSEGSAVPAVFAVGADQAETPVDFTAQGDYLVTERVAPAYVLRRGNAVAVLYNDAYQLPTLDAASPQPRAMKQKEGERGARKAIAAWLRDKEMTP